MSPAPTPRHGTIFPRPRERERVAEGRVRGFGKSGLRIFRLTWRIQKVQLWVYKRGRIVRVATESISDAFWTRGSQNRRLKADYMEFMKVVEPEWYAQQPPPPEPLREPWVEPTEADYARAAGLIVEGLKKMRILWAEKAAREDAERARRGH